MHASWANGENVGQCPSMDYLGSLLPCAFSCRQSGYRAICSKNDRLWAISLLKYLLKQTRIAHQYAFACIVPQNITYANTTRINVTGLDVKELRMIC